MLAIKRKINELDHFLLNKTLCFHLFLVTFSKYIRQWHFSKTKKPTKNRKKFNNFLLHISHFRHRYSSFINTKFLIKFDLFLDQHFRIVVCLANKLDNKWNCFSFPHFWLFWSDMYRKSQHSLCVFDKTLLLSPRSYCVPFC